LNRRIGAMTFGQRVKTRREGLGMNQMALSNRTGIRESYISGIETGKVKNPTKKMIDGLAVGLSCESSDLMSDGAFLRVFDVHGKSLVQKAS
jgi:transcriptional regulator with XRE-family HTH domain